MVTVRRISPSIAALACVASLSSLGACTTAPAPAPTDAPATTDASEPAPAVEAQPAGPPRLRRLVVDEHGGCVSDDDERVLCWGEGVLSYDAVPPSQAALREATPFDLGQGAARLVDLAIGDYSVCGLFDDDQVRCRKRRGDEIVTKSAPPGADRLTFIDVIRIEQIEPCTLADGRVSCGERPLLESVVDFAILGTDVCGLREDGALACSSIDGSRPRGEPPKQAIAGGVELGLGGRTCVRTDAGALWCSKPGRFGGELSDLSESLRAEIADVEVSLHHLCARTRAGAVICTGANGYAQLGSGDSDPHGVPITVALPGPARELAISGAHSCALVDDAILCWGSDTVGYGPAPVTMVSHTLAATDLLLDDDHSCVKLADGELRCWGSLSSLHNDTNGGIVAASRPRQAWTAVPAEAVGFYRVFGGGSLVTGDVMAYADADEFDVWWRTDGLVDAVTNDVEMCVVRRAGARLECLREGGEFDWVRIAEIPALTNVRALSISNIDLCAVTAGKVQCLAIPFDDEASGRWKAIRGITDAIDVALNEELGCALRSGGRVSCWTSSYDDDDGSYSYDVDDLFELPVADAVELVAGQFGVCVRTGAGAVACGAPTADAAELIPMIDGGAVEIAGGSEHYCARIDADGSGTSERVECHGENSHGQLGELPANVMLTPTAIAIP